MSSPGSVTGWIAELKAGNQVAAQNLWERYYSRLVALAHHKLRNRCRVADGEDVALSAFAGFCRGVEKGRFPRLDDRDDLWKLLVVISLRKASDLVKREGRKKRGGGKVHAQSVVPCTPDAHGPEMELEQIVGEEPTPDFVVEMAEEYRRLLESLGNSELQAIAVWKMEGYTNEEIAAKLGYVTVTIERRLRLIRTIWERERAQ
jgi:DNA-directed RNA polymerase specialized sigma24 family protein